MRVRSFRRLFLIFFMLCGSSLRFYEYKIWFALSNYEINAQSQELEQRLWEIFPERVLHFWPYLLKDSDGFREFLERDMPVSVETKMTKFGRFKTEIKWLEPWAKIEWQGRLWYISRDKKMWALDDEVNRNFKGNDPKIIWKISKNFPDILTSDTSFDTVPLFGVFNSPIATDKMEDFLNEFEEYKWFESVSEVTWERRAGSDLFILKSEMFGKNYNIVIQRDKYPDQDVGNLIERLFLDIAKNGSDGRYMIDATYQGKVYLR